MFWGACVPFEETKCFNNTVIKMSRVYWRLLVLDLSRYLRINYCVWHTSTFIAVTISSFNKMIKLNKTISGSCHDKQDFSLFHFNKIVWCTTRHTVTFTNKITTVFGAPWLTYNTANVAIKLLKFKFISLFSIIYTWSPTGHPEYIFPLVLTSATQELFGCRADEDVTGENPYKLLKKEDIIQDLKTRAAVSDFSPIKQLVLVRFTNTFWTRSWAEDPNLSRWSWFRVA